MQRRTKDGTCSVIDRQTDKRKNRTLTKNIQTNTQKERFQVVNETIKVALGQT